MTFVIEQNDSCSLYWQQMSEIGLPLGQLSSFAPKRRTASKQGEREGGGLATMLQAQVDSDAKATTDSSSRIRVLIVERHPAVRHALFQRLSVQPELDVVGAISSLGDRPEHQRELDAATAEDGIDILILGLQNGTDDELLETLSAVRRLAKKPLSIIVLAPYADEVERTLLRAAGVEHYLLKQIDSTHLIQEIEAAALGADPRISAD